MKTQKQATTYEQEVADDTAIDYTANMFADGNNRAAQNKKTHNARGYDEAVKTIDPEISEEADIQSSLPLDVAHSRDGTEASGNLDEDGGSLGGTEAELDSLEAGGTPVDKNPRMKG